MTNLFPYSAGVWLLHQIVGLLKTGHEVRIFALDDPGEVVVQPEVDQYGLRQRTHYLRDYHPRGYVSKVTGRVYELSMLIRRHSNLLLWLIARYYFRPRTLLDELYWIAPLLDTDCDVLHVHVEYFMWNAIMLYRLSPIPVVTTMHRVLSEHQIAQCQDAFRWGDSFIGVSYSHASRLLEGGCPSHKIEVLPNGIDLSRFSHIPEKDCPNGTFRILTVARLEEEKRLELGLQAFAQLRERLPEYQLSYTIVGDGPDRTYLESLIVELRLERQVELLGPVTNVEIARLMEQADVFVLPSITEGLPTVLIEAQAAGLPVVATNVGGVSEIVLEGHSGYLVSPEDVSELVRKLVILASSPELRQQMGQAGRAHALARFDRSNWIESLIHHYRELVEHP